MPELAEHLVLRMQDVGWHDVRALLGPSGLTIKEIADEIPIPGSHWGDEEAGLIGYELYARSDTPVHSLLHEACHWLLMDNDRRSNLHTDAKGTAVEEMAVCYLQILLSELLPKVGRARMFLDMDRWGYSFRLGSTERWFTNDAEDALNHLTNKLSHLDRITGLHIGTPGTGVLQQDNNG